jgi:hypothetical protein
MRAIDPRGARGLLVVAAAALAACGSKERDAGEPGASATRATAGPTPVKHTHGECTFEAIAPEPLTETAVDGISFTLASDSFSLQGFAGTTLYQEPNHPLDMFQGGTTTLYRGSDAGLPLAIVRSEAAAKDPKDKHAVTGAGGERPAALRTTGCRFLCDGLASREADVVAFCKSVKITVSAPKGE